VVSKASQYSIRVNDQWRICFEWSEGSLGPLNVEIVDYHYEETMARLLIHPAEHLADELKALGMSANELAKELGVPTNRITAVIRGKRGISGDTALRLGWWFGMGPDIWMNLQKNYERRLAAQEIGDALQKIPQHHGKAKTRNDLHP
jgi:addiction module HigA family antidote